MIQYPVFKPDLKVYPIPNEGAVIIGAKTTVLHGSLYAVLLPLMDGKNHIDDIALALEKDFQLAEVFYAINLLVQSGHLIEGSQQKTPWFTPLWNHVDISTDHAKSTLVNKSVGVFSIAEFDPHQFIGQLKSYDLRLNEGLDLRLFITDNYFNDELTQQAKVAYEKKIPFLVVNPYGVTPVLGPLLLPDHAGCFDCFQKRVRHCSKVEAFAFDHQQKHLQASPSGIDPLLSSMLMQMCTIETLCFLLSPASSLLHNRLVTFTYPWQLESHTLVPIPLCHVCGNQERPTIMAPIELRNQKIRTHHDGGYRTVNPAQTLNAYQHLINPICGIVDSLKPINMDKQTSVYISGFNHALSINSLKDLKNNFRSLCSGKGLGEEEAKVGALCEALERYSSLYQGSEITRHARYAEIKHEAIHPYELMLYSDLQYAQREETNIKGSKFNQVPVRFDETLSIDWSPIWNLSHQCVKWIPTTYLYLIPKRADSFCFACSNGNAAGNTLEEAILQGFFEVVERDAVGIWWYNRLQRPAVDLTSFQNNRLIALQNYYHEKNRDLWVIDLTSDLGIPTFAAISKLKNNFPERILFGFGCHFDAEIAICRAVTEMNQMFSADNHIDKLDEDETVSWLNTGTLSQHIYLQPHPTLAIRQAQDYPEPRDLDLKLQIEHAREIIESKGMEMLVADLTRADVGLPVAKVIIPGMRHFWARFAQGRLYDVPVHMGWLDKPLSESDLNPLPFFL